MAKGVQRAYLLTALMLSLSAVPSIAAARAVPMAEAKPGEETLVKRPAPKVSPTAPKTAPKVASAKAVAPKAPPVRPAQAKTSTKPASTKPGQAKPQPVKTAPTKSAPATKTAPAAKLDRETAPVAASGSAAPAALIAAHAPAGPPGCVPNLVDADFQTLPVMALESIAHRLQALGLTKGEAENSIRTLTERAGGRIDGGSVIVARYVDSCDPRRVQVISVSLALDGPTSYTWLRGTVAPATLVTVAPAMQITAPTHAPAETLTAAPVPAPVPADAAPVASTPAVEDLLVAAPPAVAEVSAPVAPSDRPQVAAITAPAPEAEQARETAKLMAFSVGPIAPKLDSSRHAFGEAPPPEAPLGFHLRVAGQVDNGDLGPALTAAGLPAAVVQQVLDSFAADGKMPLAAADELSFDVLYRTSSDTSADPVLTSAELSHGGNSRRLYYYVPEEGTAHLIDTDGKVRLAQGPDFIHPLPGYRMTSGFGWRMHPVLRQRKFHKGVDWSAPRGTPVVAAGDGIVETIKSHRGYGKYVRIVHDDRTETIYAHLDQFAKGLKVGSPVRQGQVIGTVGRTGIASGNHLYFELIVDGRHIDPLRNVPALVQDMLAEGKDKEDQQRFISFADTLLQSMPANASAADAVVATRTARTEPAPGDIP